jgi:hypothetical protein
MSCTYCRIARQPVRPVARSCRAATHACLSRSQRQRVSPAAQLRRYASRIGNRRRAPGSAAGCSPSARYLPRRCSAACSPGGAAVTPAALPRDAPATWCRPTRLDALSRSPPAVPPPSARRRLGRTLIRPACRPCLPLHHGGRRDPPLPFQAVAPTPPLTRRRSDARSGSHHRRRVDPLLAAAKGSREMVHLGMPAMEPDPS